MSGEFDLIRRIRDRLPAPAAGTVGIGDDCAVLPDRTLVALDTMVEGVHFRLDWCPPRSVGWKALAVNVSDVAAMGGDPTACVVGVTLPSDGRPGLADDLLAGLADAAAALSCPLLGGDTTSGPTLVISVAILGRAPASGAVLRSGAGPGDAVFVTGRLGLATSALDALLAGDTPPPHAASRLHEPDPRVPEGRAAAAGGATAMIDVSDGLAADLGHLCEASAVGVRVEEAALPLAPGVDVDRALTGGDDYELCFTAADPEAVAAAFSAAGLRPPTRIGTVTADAGERLLVAPDGATRPLPPGSWEHPLGA